MNDQDQTQAFASDLEKLIDRYRDEFDVRYAQIVGVLHLQAHFLCSEAKILNDEDKTP